MLDAAKKAICQRTISSRAFYYLVLDALERRQALSVVRMGDGEKTLWEEALTPPFGADVKGYNPEWLKELGCEKLTKQTLKQHLACAGNFCTYFAPSISGIEREEYDLYSIFPHNEYVDNFFVDEWTQEMKQRLYKAAGAILLIHRSLILADAFQLRAVYGLGIKLNWSKLDMWQDAHAVVQFAIDDRAPLVLFSGGPASKWIGPAIAETGKVVLDIGHAMDRWIPDLPGRFSHGKGWEKD